MFGRRDTDAGSAGLDYYNVRLASWKKHMLLPLGLALLTSAAIAVPVWMFFPHGPLFAVAFVSATYGMSAWIWTDPPHHIAKWKQGAEGERWTARALGRLEPEWRSVHGREARYGDLDHITVGPGGIFLLNSKNLYGTLTVDEEGLTADLGPADCDSFTNKKLSSAMNAEARRLKELIRASTGLTYTVRAVVVVWGHFPAGEGCHGGVHYVAGERLEGWLRAQPMRLSNRDAELIRLGLEAEIIVPRAKPLIDPALS